MDVGPEVVILDSFGWAFGTGLVTAANRDIHSGLKFETRALLYGLTIEQFLMHPFSICASLCSAFVSKMPL